MKTWSAYSLNVDVVPELNDYIMKASSKIRTSALGGESGNSTSDTKHFMISDLVPLCAWPAEDRVGGNSLCS